MSVSSKYFEYLNHFGRTVSLNEMVQAYDDRHMVALRHDVDHDLDIALEMSYWEFRKEVRATYFLLPDAKYWNDPSLVDKCLQIQDFGHEIGLHLNTISEWIRGHIDSPVQRLAELLSFLRSSGVKISGTSAHGDKLCYEKQYINYWLFQELRSEDPAHTESGLSAEGVRVDDRRYVIAYPDDHCLTRADGKILPLWSVSMAALCLSYHAYHVPHDRYFTDSGGGWKRSPDPLNEDFGTGRHQVLIHPEYWRGPQKIYFFLSAARSGSKWLSTILNQATSFVCKHEFSLNHQYKNDVLVYEHLTGTGFVSLDADKIKAKKLLLDIRTWIEESGADYAEMNVYLERFFPLLQEVFPDAKFVHLYRNPADVVRSILNREWYDTPLDNRHPIINVDGWKGLSQFEKACWYVRSANDSLMSIDSKIRFEQMVSDFAYLECVLRELGIPFYPLLGRKIFNIKINSNRINDFPNLHSWNSICKRAYAMICSDVEIKLKYDNFDNQFSNQGDKKYCFFSNLKNLFIKILVYFKTHNDSIKHLDFNYTLDSFKNNLSIKNCKLRHINSTIEIYPQEDSNSYVLLGGGQWYKNIERTGWAPLPGRYYHSNIQAEIFGVGEVRVFCLIYDAKGKLCDKKLLSIIKGAQTDYTFTFRVRPNALKFNIALYFSKDHEVDKLLIKQINIYSCKS